MAQKYFRNPFAVSGSRTDVSDVSSSTLVSYESGYTSAYELDPSEDTDGRYIDRSRMNQLFYDITLSIKQLQENAFPEWISDADGSGTPFSYDQYAVVQYNGGYYVSTSDSNTGTPGTDSTWEAWQGGSSASDADEYINANDPVSLADGSGTSLEDMTFSPARQFRNRSLEPTWPVVDVDFQNMPVTAGFRFAEETVTVGSALTKSYGDAGLTLTNNTGARSVSFFELPAGFVVPGGIVTLRVGSHSGGHNIGAAMFSDTDNWFGAINEQESDENEFKTITRVAGTSTDQQTGVSLGTDDAGYSISLIFGNDGVMAVGTDSVNGFTLLQTVEVDQGLTDPDTLKGYRPAIRVDLDDAESITIESFSAGYSIGAAHGGVRSVTYENGEPVQKDGRFYITATSKFSGLNGAQHPLTVFAVDKQTYKMEPVAQITVRNSGVLENGTASKIVYDRNSKQWIYVSRAFPSPGGEVMLGTTTKNLISPGIHIIDVDDITGIATDSLDADLIYRADQWYLVYHGGSGTRTLRIATSTDLSTWTEITDQTSGEGLTVAVVNGEYRIIDARSDSTIGVSSFDEDGTVTLLTTLTLDPNPGVSGATVGWPWGAVIPMWNGSECSYTMVVFTNDEWVADVDDFSYGELWFYNANETNSLSEFEQTSEYLQLGF
jgi:hypothetical protein